MMEGNDQMQHGYKSWLAQQGYAENTQVAQLHRVKKVEQVYGSLDDLLENGEFDKMISELTYSTEDERRQRPNPSRLKFTGNIRNNLQSYKNAAIRYRRFREEVAELPPVPFTGDGEDDVPADMHPKKQRLALEGDMQSALRHDISALEPGLAIIDDGAEHAVSSGFIDILCEDENGGAVVVELKAGTTDSRVIAQILGYMGDILKDRPEGQVRGIIVAHDFDKRTRSAAFATLNIELVRYAISFQFEREK